MVGLARVYLQMAARSKSGKRQLVCIHYKPGN